MNFVRNMLPVLSMIICLWISASVQAFQSDSIIATVELRDGSDFEAQFLGVDNDTASFSQNGNTKAVSIENINRIQYSSQPGEPSDLANSIKLVDGSEFFCQAFTLVDRELIAESESGVRVRINTRLVDHIRFPSVDSEFLENWETTSQLQRESDALIVSRNQKLQMIDGIVGDVSAENVSFTVGDRSADIKRSRLSGILFYRRATVEFAPSTFVLQLNDGSSIEGQSLSTDNDSFKVRSVSGAIFIVKPTSIVQADFSSKREAWLTDLEPATNDWSPLISGSSIIATLKKFSKAKIDRSFSGKPLAVLIRGDDESWKRIEYPKGFAIKGGGKLSYILGKQYQRITGSIAFDPDANATGIAKLIIQVDGSTRVEKVLDASEMKTPFALDINLNNADRIVFQVDYHDRRSVGDILHAVDMKLTR